MQLHLVHTRYPRIQIGHIKSVLGENEPNPQPASMTEAGG